MGIIILFGILINQPNGTDFFFVRFHSKKECIVERKYMETKYGTDNFSGFCVKEVR